MYFLLTCLCCFSCPQGLFPYITKKGSLPLCLVSNLCKLVCYFRTMQSVVQSDCLHLDSLKYTLN
uniref:Uncharacterized protein n=1 Tax=Anguilla anguilla TaxID=7936 RepID=A0A0E9PJM7_ANGAN